MKKQAIDQRGELKQCAICGDDFWQIAGVECVPVKLHFVCFSCFDLHVKTQSTEDFRNLEQQQARVYCTNKGHDCKDSQPYEDSVIASAVTDETFTLYQAARLKLTEQKLAKEMEAQKKAAVEAELKRLAAMSERERLVR